jgi:hypothetical protein
VVEAPRYPADKSGAGQDDARTAARTTGEHARQGLIDAGPRIGMTGDARHDD